MKEYLSACESAHRNFTGQVKVGKSSLFRERGVHIKDHLLSVS